MSESDRKKCLERFYEDVHSAVKIHRKDILPGDVCSVLLRYACFLAYTHANSLEDAKRYIFEEISKCADYYNENKETTWKQ